MAITNIDDLDNFAVSTKHSNGMQLLTFHVTTIKTLNPHLVSTTIKNLNEKDFEAIWRYMIHITYTEILKKAANNKLT